jgi:hypothetical protein
LTPGLHPRKPAPMSILETVTTTEHRCEALTIGDIPGLSLHHQRRRRP